MVAYPTRGIDINSSYAIYNLLNEQKKKGVAVICVIEDLDVLLELCDPDSCSVWRSDHWRAGWTDCKEG